MAQKCRTCTHPHRELIEQALANTRARRNGGVQAVSDKWSIPRSSLQRHLTNCMSQDLVARLRMGMPDPIDISIEEIIRQEGEGAIIGLRKLKEEHRAAAERWEHMGEFEQARKERIELRRVHEALAQYAGMIPGRKQVTNNNLVLGDVSTLFDTIDAVLRPFPEARRAVAQALAMQQPRPALEHAA
ncbi:hypothetical protein [Lysobacter niastensis]|uniref:Uncharacterized protein n=1 Tax=Lysobacter niastensis TaxID=380629 RepID=A0ABS0B302_9GAMM|nr:hypothetical protein [Lysobacter niastensis]MBF6022864.1 hypothetical protein [Lysobacter niastensis]